MHGLIVGFISFSFLIVLEIATYWLTRFTPVGTGFLAAILGALAGFVYVKAQSTVGKRVAISGAAVVTALPLVTLFIWAVTVWRAVGTVEAGMQFLRIPAGCFAMGNPSPQRTDWFEVPVHEVCLKPFELAKYEVTQQEWARVMIYPNDPNPRDPTDYPTHYPLKGNRLTVGNVSWDEAKHFARLMSFFGRGSYRLPTEAEWEYAARAETKTQYYWGDQPEEACAYENILDLSMDKLRRSGLPPRGLVQCDDGYAGPAPVGSFKPNPWGLHDMLGNVHEWVEDCWEISYRDAPRDGSAVEKKEPCFRVVRGGDWFSGSEGAASFKVTRRTNNYQMRVITYTGPNYGVRLAKSVAEAR